MSRLRLYDIRLSSLPGDVGLCVGDVASIAQAVNAAERRLLYAKEAGDEGWWGTFAEVAWNVNSASPYITLPRQIARIQSAVVCTTAVPIQNQFFQYLQFGNGRLPRLTSTLCPGRPTQMLARNNAVTFVDLTSPPQYIAIFPTDPADVQANRRVLLQGLDNNDQTIYSQDAQARVTGQFIPLELPFATSPMTFNNLTGIQKDVTVGPVQFYQMDPTTGTQTLLLTMEPSEQVASYRRYYIDALPRDCCNGQAASAIAQVSAVVKLEPIPVQTDTDYLLLQNLEALTEECQALRYSKIDSANAAQMEAKCHARAIGHLKGELVHYLGKDDPAVNFAPFGSARLERLRVSMQ